MTSPRPAYPFFSFFSPGSTRHPTKRQHGHGELGTSVRAIRSTTPRRELEGRKRNGLYVPELRGLFVLRTLSHSAKELSLNKKMPINNCVLRDTVLHENPSLGHLDFSTKNTYALIYEPPCSSGQYGSSHRTSLCLQGAA